MTPAFQRAHAFVAEWEGGFVDDPQDPGGATKWGVTIRTLIAKGLDLNNDGAINRQDIHDMTPGQAERIYWESYWQASGAPDLPEGLALVHYDSAVNQGPGRAARFLQKSVGAKVDGIIGPKTLAAVRGRWSADPDRVLREYCVNRALHYSSLSIFARFGRGWMRRLFAAHAAALAA